MQHRMKEFSMTPEATLALLGRGQVGVLSTSGADGAPYGVPVHYLWPVSYTHLDVYKRQADHLTEQPGAENDAALFGYRSGDHSGDAQFQVVAGEGEGIPFRPDQNAFQGLESGAGGHRPGYIGDRGREHGLVAGKLHLKNLPFSTAP